MGYSDWLHKRAYLSPGRTALLTASGEEQWNFAQLNSRVNQTARLLYEKYNVRKGDVVALLAGNCVEYIEVFLALGRLGAILQNLNWRLAAPSLVSIVQDGGPKLFIYTPEFTTVAAQVRRELGGIQSFLALSGQEFPAEAPLDGRLTERSDFSDQLFRPQLVDWDDPWVICYTGGTTGLPKGAILSHRNITFNAINTVNSWDLDHTDRAILNAPLFHTGGLNVFTVPLLYCGGSSIICSSFDAEQVFELIKQNDVTVFFGVPTMFIMMQEHRRWDEADFSRLKLVISGGAPCPMPVFERFWKKDVDFKTGYGLTEAGPNNFWLPRGLVRTKPGHVGFPLLHVDIELRDENNRPVTSPDTSGEVCIRGPHVTPGYWNNPEATQQCIDQDGWLHTGDLGMQDADGSFSIVGRLKDVIISGGENIYPAEVESVMHGHPDVAEAALLGVPDDRWGEVGRAVLVPHENHTLDPAEFMAWLKERLASYKVPKTIVVTRAIPKTAAGKMDRKEMKKVFVDEYEPVN